ncbi:MAG: hypothetical protein AB1515_01695 [Nitrospirota bacterium]
MNVIGVKVSGLLVAIALVGCGPRMVIEPPALPKEAITFQAGYTETFDRVLRALDAEGYDVVIADRQRGYIETRPRTLAKPEGGGPFEYQTYLIVRVGGGWRESWATVRSLVLPGYPKERQQLIDRLQGGKSPPPPEGETP